MSMKPDDDFSSGDWIRRESRSRPNQFYYYDKVTKESHWDRAPKQSSEPIVRVNSTTVKPAPISTQTDRPKHKDNASKSSRGK